MTNFASNDLTADQLNSLVKKAGGHEQVLRILSGELKIQILSTTSDPDVAIPDETEQFLTVSSDLAFGERIFRGNYGSINCSLTEDMFPVTEDQHGEWEWKLFRFKENLSCENLIRLIKKDGFEPAQTGHILTFGEINPEEQRKYPIIGLGSIAEVGLGRVVLGPWSDYDRRELHLYWFVDDWRDYFRFLGVRRRSVA